MRRTACAVAVTAAGVCAGGAFAEVTWTLDQAAWTSQVGGPGAVTQIDFGTVPLDTILKEQFSAQGLHFTDGNDFRAEVAGQDPPIPVVLGGPILPTLNYPITMRFDQMLTGFSAMQFTGDFGVQLYHDSELVGSAAVDGLASFQIVGFVSDVPFNRVVVLPNIGSANHIAAMGNISFAVPSPAGVALMACAGLLAPGRDRRRRR
ncbi:MAG: hypothetical protein U0574_10585 [Phycisphaerales bacterium]